MDLSLHARHVATVFEQGWHREERWSTDVELAWLAALSIAGELAPALDPRPLGSAHTAIARCWNRCPHDHPAQIDPIAVALGPLKIHWYGIMYLLGFAVCWCSAGAASVPAIARIN